MAINRRAGNIIDCLAADTKPSLSIDASLLIEKDTQKLFVLDTSWKEINYLSLDDKLISYTDSDTALGSSVIGLLVKRSNAANDQWASIIGLEAYNGKGVRLQGSGNGCTIVHYDGSSDARFLEYTRSTNILKLDSDVDITEDLIIGGDLYLDTTAIGIGTMSIGSDLAQPNDTRLHIVGSGSTTSNRTQISVKNTASSGAARIHLENSAGNFLSFQISGPEYSIGEQASFGAVGCRMILGTDGDSSTGGSSPIQFRPGGYNDSNISMQLLANGNILFGRNSSSEFQFLGQSQFNGDITLGDGVTINPVLNMKNSAGGTEVRLTVEDLEFHVGAGTYVGTANIVKPPFGFKRVVRNVFESVLDYTQVTTTPSVIFTLPENSRILSIEYSSNLADNLGEHLSSMLSYDGSNYITDGMTGDVNSTWKTLTVYLNKTLLNEYTSSSKAISIAAEDTFTQGEIKLRIIIETKL